MFPRACLAYNALRNILYTQFREITHVTHVLPRLLAHVLAITSHSVYVVCENRRLNFTTIKKSSSLPLAVQVKFLIKYCQIFLTAAAG